MSHYADLSIAGLSVWEMRNEADFPVMVLFHPDDKITYDGDLDGEVSQRHEYRVKVERFRTRLDAMGLTLQSAIDRFNEGLAALPEKMALTKYEKKLFSNLTFETWRQCMTTIIHNKLSKWNYKEKLPSLSLSPDHEDYVRFIFGDFTFEEAENIPEYYFSGSFYLGFSLYYHAETSVQEQQHVELGHIFRAVAEVVDKDELVQFDYSSLISWGTYTGDEDITEIPETTLVLTEGSIDRIIIEKTLELLHPDLAKYYSFLDFHTPNLQGGTTALVHLLKGFVGAGIRNRIIALFDNDTAAQDSLRALKGISLPWNIRILLLPELDHAREYPTLGPQGHIPVDINGLACSIELYLGKDILAMSTGELSPVQWKGYNSKLEKYQGEVIGKSDIQKRYLKLLKSISAGSIDKNAHDWSGMEKLLSVLFSAFNYPAEIPFQQSA